MDEAELGRVQRLAVKIQSFQYLAMRRPGPAVDRVAEQGMADRGHVDPDLVGPPGFEPAFDQGGVAQRPHRFGNGSPPACRVRPSTIAIFLRFADERASGASTVPAGGTGSPATIAR